MRDNVIEMGGHVYGCVRDTDSGADTGRMEVNVMDMQMTSSK